MADWEYSIEGHLAADGHREYEPPDDVSDTDGLLVHGWDKNDPENDIWFWVYDPEFFDNLEDAHYLIEVQFEEYGIPSG